MTAAPAGRALIVGGSRGIGAAIVRVLAIAGWKVAFTYNKHRLRSEKLVEGLPQGCERPLIRQLDVCDPEAVERMAAFVAERLGAIDCLVLSASGGLELDKPASYAREINVDAQLRLVRTMLPSIAAGGRVVFLTSHEAHFSDRMAPYPPYAAIAETKRLGETELRRLFGRLADRPVALEIVSADLVEGTATAKLLEMNDPERIEARRAEVGALPTPDDVAARVLELCRLNRGGGVFTTYVWEPDARYSDLQRRSG